MPGQSSHVIPGRAPPLPDVTDIMSPTNLSRRQGVASRQLLYIVLLCTALFSGPLNVAVDRPTFSAGRSSYAFHASNAVSGHRMKPSFYYCYQSYMTVNPWWSVDLGNTMLVTSVVITSPVTHGKSCLFMIETKI